jgi:hypothetical protein
MEESSQLCDVRGPEIWVVRAKGKIRSQIELCVLVIGSDVSCTLCDLALTPCGT